MNLKIGEKIKELRTSQGVTQEKLADYLSVTPQAVSRWENGSGYPDIELLPSIVTFFGTSLDILMGIDLSIAEQDRIIFELSALLKSGDISGVIADGKEAAKTFPSNYAILGIVSSAIIVKYASKHVKADESERKNMLEEALSYSKRIIDDAKDINVVLGAKQIAITALCALDRDNEAADIAATLPTAVFCRENNLSMCLTGEARLDYLRNLLPLIISMFTTILNRVKYPAKDEGLPIFRFTFEDCERALKIWDAAYDNGNADFDNVKKKCSLYMLLNLYAAKTAFVNGDTAVSEKYLNTALECAELIDGSEKAFEDMRCNELLKNGIAKDPDCKIPEEDIPTTTAVDIIKKGFIDSGFFS